MCSLSSVCAKRPAALHVPNNSDRIRCKTVRRRWKVAYIPGFEAQCQVIVLKHNALVEWRLHCAKQCESDIQTNDRGESELLSHNASGVLAWSIVRHDIDDEKVLRQRIG